MDELRRILEALPRGTNAGARDRALLLVGFRRSELVALDVDDLEETVDGKMDQEGAGRELGIPWGAHPATCPVRDLRA
ncbi:MAG: hypothetical protein ACREQM_19260 [Candidatus Dormibacteraceae bacterium]